MPTHTAPPPAIDPTPGAVVRFKRAFLRPGPPAPIPLDWVYAPDVAYADPFDRVRGVAALRAHFAALAGRVVVTGLRFHDQVVVAGTAALAWVMTVRLAGRTVAVPGVTLLRFGDRVHYQRDYFDAAELAPPVPAPGWRDRARAWWAGIRWPLAGRGERMSAGRNRGNP